MQSGRRSIAEHTRAPGPAGDDSAGHSLSGAHTCALSPGPAAEAPGLAAPSGRHFSSHPGSFNSELPRQKFKKNPTDPQSPQATHTRSSQTPARLRQPCLYSHAEPLRTRPAGPRRPGLP